MARVAFIGLGNMGGGMAANLAKVGHEVRAFDLSEKALTKAEGKGCTGAASAEEAVMDAEAVITMLTCSELFHTDNRSIVIGDLESTKDKATGTVTKPE